MCGDLSHPPSVADFVGATSVGPPEAPWVAKLPASVASAGYYAEPDGNAAEVQQSIDAAFGSDADFVGDSGFGSVANDMPTASGLQLPNAGSDALRLSGLREAAQARKDAAAASAAAWRRLGHQCSR